MLHKTHFSLTTHELLLHVAPCCFAFVRYIIRWRSISMRVGRAFLEFDWSKAGLSMDLPVFVYSHTKTSFRFLSTQTNYREAFYVVTDLLLQATQRETYRALVLSRLRLSRSTDHQDRNLHSLSHRFQSSCSKVYYFVFCMSVNMYVFNLKSCKECHKTRKKSRK